MMKLTRRIVIVMLFMFIMTGCTKTEETEVEAVRVDCYRRWFYAFDKYSEDKEYIDRLYDAISQMKLGEETAGLVTDYTDIIEFTFSDGHKERYEFEADMFVDQDRRKFIVAEGLPLIREVLDELMSKK